MRWLVAFFVVVAPAICRATAPVGGESETRPGSPTPATVSSNSPVDQLIPWLLDEDRQLRGIPFSEVIFDVTGKRVLPFDPQNEADQRVVKQISAACDETMKRLNAPDSVIQNVGRINEVSSRFEDTLRKLLSSTSGLSCDFPPTIEGKVQRSGYPDLRSVDLATRRVFYLDPKLYAVGSRKAVSAHFISNRKKRRTKCAIVRCISSSGSNTSGGRKMDAGNSRVGTSSTFPISRWS